jgi:hypothetical protein
MPFHSRALNFLQFFWFPLLLPAGSFSANSRISEGWQLDPGYNNANFHHAWQDLIIREAVKACQALIPVNTGHWAFEHRFFNEVFRPAFRFDDFGFLGLFVQPENLGANLFTTAAPYALILIDAYSSFHLHLPLRRNRMSGPCYIL